MKNKKLSLDEISVFIRNGVTIKQNNLEKQGYPITRIETIASGVIDETRMGYAGIFEKEKYREWFLEDEDILISHINSEKHLGKSAIYIGENDRIIHGMNLLCLRVKKEIVLPKYLYFYFKSLKYKVSIGKISKKSVNQASFSIKDFKEIELEIPNIEIQKKIVLILDKLVEILKDKKEILLQLEELSKSIFICTFGDLSINNKNFEMKKIKEIAEIFIGVTYQPQDVVDLEEKGIVVLRSGNIQNFMLDFKDILKIKKDIKEKFFIRNRDILMCSRNGSSNLVGKVAIIDNLTEKMTFGAFMTIIRSEYYTYLYNYFKSSYFKKSKIFRKTTTINQITKIELENLIIPIPDIELQNQFAERIKIIEKSKVRFFRGVA